MLAAFHAVVGVLYESSNTKMTQLIAISYIEHQQWRGNV
jgi:hypothetical protein